MMGKDGSLEIELLKAILKPGYLYAVSEDKERLYCIPADLPKPGETIVMPPFHMPKEEEE